MNEMTRGSKCFMLSSHREALCRSNEWLRLSWCVTCSGRSSEERVSLVRDRGMYHSMYSWYVRTSYNPCSCMVSMCAVSIQAVIHSCWTAYQSSACHPVLDCLHSKRTDVRRGDIGMKCKHYSDGVGLTSQRLTAASYRWEGAQPGRNRIVALSVVAHTAPPYVHRSASMLSPIV